MIMELEKGGECFEWKLKRMARFCLLENGDSDGVIDNLLSPENITYQDIVGFLTREGGEAPSLLKMLFDGVKENSSLLARWLCDPDMDDKILAKGVQTEFFLLLSSRLGLEVPDSTLLAEVREKTLRYVLVGEFRDDLSCDAPPSVTMVPEPQNKDQLSLIRKTALAMRDNHPVAYASIARNMEKELGLSAQPIEPSALGRVDTFPFGRKGASQMGRGTHFERTIHAGLDAYLRTAAKLLGGPDSGAAISMDSLPSYGAIGGPHPGGAKGTLKSRSNACAMDRCLL